MSGRSHHKTPASEVRTPIVIWGAGGHARVVASALRATNKYEIVGFLDNTNPDLCGESFAGAMILGGDGELPRLRQAGVRLAFVAIGDNAARLRLGEQLQQYGLTLPVIIHPHAMVDDDATLGAGTFVAAGAVVAAQCTLGAGVIVNHLASVDHDCIVEDGAHISPGGRLAGRVRIGRTAWIGMNASVRERVHVGHNAIVGAGAVVVKNVADGITVCGVPARPLRDSNTAETSPPAVEPVGRAPVVVPIDASDDTLSFVQPTSPREAATADGTAKGLAIFGGPPAFAEKLYVGRPNIPTPAKLITRIEEAINRRWLSNDGPFVRELEHRLSRYLGDVEVVTVSNATLGLQLVARALNLTGEVLLPAMTFVATAHALEWEGLTPVFCDVDASGHNIDPDDVARRVNERTSAIVGVHLWGLPCDVDRLSEIAEKHNLKLMFDAAHAFACSYRGQMIGGFGDAEVFSFHATKFVNTLEGGAITTRNVELAASLRLMRNFGFAGIDKIEQLGINAKMNEFSAAMGLACLDDLDDFLDTNEMNYRHYCQLFADTPGIRVTGPKTRQRFNYQYVVLDVDPQLCPLTRDELSQVLWAENVIARRYFYPGCHRVDPYASRQIMVLPNTDRLCGRLLALPTGTAVSLDTISRIGNLVHRALAQSSEIRARLRNPLQHAA